MKMSDVEDYTPKCFKTEEYCETNMICKQCRQYPDCGKSESECEKIKKEPKFHYDFYEDYDEEDGMKGGKN